MLKKYLSSFFVIATFLVFTTSCRNFIESSDVSEEQLFASLEVKQSSSARALDLSENGICYAVVSVSGSGISSPISSDYVKIDGGGRGTVNIGRIPVGKNRIVTVQGYDSSKNAINGAVIRNVCDLNSGSNSCSVTQATTALGNAFNSLLSKNINLSTVDKSKIEAAIDSAKSWALIDTEKIASDYISNSLSSDKTFYYIKTGTVNIENKIAGSNYSIKILDPSSKVTKIDSKVSILDCAPGTWTVQLLDSSSNIVASKNDLKVISEKTSTITISDVSSAVSGKIIVHVPSSTDYKEVYYWGGDVPSGSAWPGNDMKQESSGYYCELKGTKTNIIFNNGSDSSKTNDLYITEGEWEYIGTNGGEKDTTGSNISKNFKKIESLLPSSPILSFENAADPKDGIIVHAKQPYIYIWESGVSTLDQTTQSMTSEENGWYRYEISATSANIIFKNSNSWEWQTADLSRTEKGEYWFVASSSNNKTTGEWFTSNPDDSVPPVLSSFTSSASGNVSGSVTLTAVATDNSGLKNVTFTLSDGTVIAVVNAENTNATATCEWDTTKVQNGTYTVKAVAYDAANNASEEKTISFTTQNANLPPVAVISGTSSATTESSKIFDAASSYDQNGGTIASYSWSVSGGATVVGETTSKTLTVKMPSNATTVKITLQVTDNEGEKSESVSKEIKVVEKTESIGGDFRDETIYFLMTTRFYDGDSSNNEYCWDEGGDYLKFGDDVKDCAWRGDFKGLADKLDYIKALGFSAIWITPVVQNASGIDYHGYHAYNFKKVDPRYESKDFTYQDLINACHKKGIKVIQDIVLNHTGNFGEENLFHMFDKENIAYVNKIATKTNIPRSPFMKVAKDGKTILGGNAYEKLMTGLKMAGGSDYDAAAGGIQYGARINAMKEDSIDTELIYHHEKMIDWNSEKCQLGQMAGDCVDLNTENPAVFNYLIEAYNQYIDMGVDAFRIDTVKHISRYTFNKAFIPAFKERGGDDFYIFGETCARYRGRWNEGVPALSPSFYTWKETVNLPWNSTGGAAESKTNSASATAHFTTYRSGFEHPAWAGGIANHLLNGNNYHAPDYSMRSGLDQIDFPMHWAFNSANDAFGAAVFTNDPDFNDATWNVTYVDSHDYAPDNAPESQRFNGYWPDKLNLIFTFRGIPCIYYGSEIEFKKGMPIDPANIKTSLENSGRAYFGDHLEGSVTATDYGEYSASGEVANTLNHELAQHIIRLNQIRRAIPALRKGQYSKENSGSIAFKRRYTDNDVDSFALVAINGGATFSGLPGGTYVEVITGKSVSIGEGGSIATDSIGEGNMRVYVNTSLKGCNVSGKIGKDGAYLK